MGWMRARNGVNQHHEEQEEGEEEEEEEEEEDGDSDVDADDSNDEGDDDDDYSIDDDEDDYQAARGRHRTNTTTKRTKSTSRPSSTSIPSSKSASSKAKPSPPSFPRDSHASRSHSAPPRTTHSLSGPSTKGGIQSSPGGGGLKARPRARDSPRPKASPVSTALVVHYNEQPTHTSSMLVPYEPMTTHTNTNTRTTDYHTKYCSKNTTKRSTNTDYSNDSTTSKKRKVKVIAVAPKAPDGFGTRTRARGGGTGYQSTAGSSRGASRSNTTNINNINNIAAAPTTTTTNKRKVKKKKKNSSPSGEMAEFDAFISDRGEWTHASTSMMRAGSNRLVDRYYHRYLLLSTPSSPTATPYPHCTTTIILNDISDSNIPIP